MTDLIKKLTSLAGRFQSELVPVNRLQPVFLNVDSGQPSLDKVRFDGREYSVTPRFRESLKRLYKAPLVFTTASVGGCVKRGEYGRFKNPIVI